MFLLKVSFLYFRALCKKTMKRFVTKKKESGADGRKRRKLEAEKSNKFFMPFFEKPGTSRSTRSMESPAPATSLLESEDGSSTNA